MLLILNSCASIDGAITPTEPGAVPGGGSAAGVTRFEEWSVTTISLGNSGSQVAAPAAVVKLSRQADAQIAASAWQAASDTLERLLRIAPDYAPGWSRMAWLALQTGEADRARQMAARSNSYATGRIDLKLLNWKFSREASVLLNDRAATQRADRNIQALENM